MEREAHIGFSPGGLATGIGSVPYLNADEALDLIFSELPDIPHWPQLPRLGEREHFVHQFLKPLVSCGTLEAVAGHWTFNTSRDDNAACLTDFYTTCLPAEEGDGECLHGFLPPEEAAIGFHAFLSRARTDVFKQAQYVKGQIAGPLSVALSLKDLDGRPAYYQGDLRDIIVRTLALNAHSQAAALAGSGRTPIIFVDDPAISAYGSRLHLALDRTTIIEDLNFIFSAIRSGEALAGVHACEALDWSLLLESDMQILSIDAFRFGASLIPYAEQLVRFIRRGGVVAWGIVPTLEDPFGESVESLFNRLLALWHELFFKRLDHQSVLRNSMITPSCGTGLLTIERARRIYRLTADLSRHLRGRHERIDPILFP